MAQTTPSIPASKTTVNSKASFMTIEEVSEFLRIPKRTLYEWVSQRRIPHFKFGGTLLRFKADEIKEWTRRHHREENAF